MIRDVLIIKDGLPLLSKSFSNSKNFISNKNNLILISGFLSALSSFSEEFEDLGSIKELKLSNSRLRLAFLKKNELPNLIFLASYDENTNSVNVQRFLRKMSYSFFKNYDINKISNWDGSSDTFLNFSNIIKEQVEKISDEKETDFEEKVITLFERIQKRIDDVAVPQEEKELSEKHPHKSQEISHKKPKYIPILKCSDNINPDFYLTGKKAKEVLKEIDGAISVKEIAQRLHLSEEKVYNICKNLVKLGFISLEK
jgi:hypothetical protein